MDEKTRRVAEAYAEECYEEELELLRTLAQIPAPSGHEERRAEFIRDWLLAQGAPVGAVRVDDAKNVILSLPGPTGGDDGIAVFAAHTDVVFPDTEPLPLAESATRLLAPGVGDDTANLVGLLLAARYLLRHKVPLDRRLLVVANSCEEGLGNLAGTRELFRHYDGQVREFTSFDLYLGMHVVSAVGSHRWRVKCHTEGGLRARQRDRGALQLHRGPLRARAAHARQDHDQRGPVRGRHHGELHRRGRERARGVPLGLRGVPRGDVR